MKKVLMLIAAMGLFSFAGCSEGDDDSESNTVTGAWKFMNLRGSQETLQLNHTEGRVSGSTDRGGTVANISMIHQNELGCFLMINYPNNYTLWIKGDVSGDTLTGTLTDSSHRDVPFTATRVDYSGSGGSDGGGSSSGGNAVITQAEYDQIQIGMTYDQVVAIVGDEGQIAQSGGGTLIVVWQNYSPASFAQVGFLNDRVEIKDNSRNLP